MVGGNINARKVKNNLVNRVILMSLCLCPDKLYPEIFRKLVVVIM